MKRGMVGCAILILALFSCNSCVKKGLYKGPDEEPSDEKVYVYPYGNERDNVVAEITVQTDGTVDLDQVSVEMPKLKYNKSWLFLLSLDDCRQDAFSCGWAAINGKPLSPKYYYDIDHLKAGDLPPDAYYVGKTLGSTDGAGNEVRFSFAITLSAEWDWMDLDPVVKVGFEENYFRFFMKSGLSWKNVIEMLHYGTGIAFHNVRTKDESNIDSVGYHFMTTQAIIQDKLSGRGCKFLAEPDGNKAYITAAQGYKPIQIMTAQAGAETLYPFNTERDLEKTVMARTFASEAGIKQIVEEQLRLQKEKRRAVQIGMHGVGKDWVEFLQWMNDTYGKDGDDSVWFTSLEEYFEYNYYRIHGSVEKRVEGNDVKITVRMPSGQYFYYPSVTVNLKGLDKQKVKGIISGNTVTGLSSGAYDEGTMINLDCRKFLVEHATHFVEQYEGDATESNRNDALYFVNMLKDSAKKTELLKRIK